LHRKIIEKTIASLPKDKMGYFEAVARQLENDARFEHQGNIVFSILKDIIPDTPIYLDKDEFVDLLFDFIRYNNPAIRGVMYSRPFIHDPHVLRTVSVNLISQIIARSLEKHELGEIETDDPSVHKLTWPYRDTDVLDPDDDPEEWLAAIQRSELWKREQKVDRRKSGLSRIDDKAMALMTERNDRKAKDDKKK